MPLIWAGEVALKEELRDLLTPQGVQKFALDTRCRRASLAAILYEREVSSTDTCRATGCDMCDVCRGNVKFPPQAHPGRGAGVAQAGREDVGSMASSADPAPGVSAQRPRLPLPASREVSTTVAGLVFRQLHTDQPVVSDHCWVCGSQKCMYGLTGCARWSELTTLPERPVCLADGGSHMKSGVCSRIHVAVSGARCRACLLPLSAVEGVQFHTASRPGCAKAVGDRTQGLLLLLFRSQRLRAGLMRAHGSTLVATPEWFQDKTVQDSAIVVFNTWLIMESAHRKGVLNLDIALAHLFKMVVVSKVKDRSRMERRV